MTERTPETPSAEGGVTVSGTGRAVAVPDVFVAVLAATATSERPAAAMDAAAGGLTRMRSAALARGAEAAGLTTGSMTLHQAWDDQGRPNGFTAELVLTVRTPQVAGAGELLSGCIAAGGEQARLQSTSFEHADPSALLASAREAAFTDAVARARQLARHAGRRLGPVVSVEEVGGGHRPGPQSARFASGQAAGPPVDPGSLAATVTVVVRWAWIN